MSFANRWKDALKQRKDNHKQQEEESDRLYQIKLEQEKQSDIKDIQEALDDKINSATNKTLGYNALIIIYSTEYLKCQRFKRIIHDKEFPNEPEGTFLKYDEVNGSQDRIWDGDLSKVWRDCTISLHLK